MSKFKIAIVGSGMIAQVSHIPAVLGHPETELVALVDIEVERARKAAQAYGTTAQVVSSLDQVLDDADGVIIATPNDSHEPLALQCISAGVPVLIEKPIATTLQQGESIVRAAEAAGVPLAVGYYTRFWRSSVLLKELLSRGALGEPVRFVHQYGTRGGWSPLSGYILKKETSGGGVLVVTGSHFLDRMIFLFGYPEISAMYSDSHGGPEANCVARFRFGANGSAFNGTVRYSKTMALPGGMVLETTDGIVVIGEGDYGEIVFRPRNGAGIEQVVRRTRQRSDRVSPFLMQLGDFVDACRERRQPSVDGRSSLASLRLIEQLYALAQPIDEHWYVDLAKETRV